MVALAHHGLGCEHAALAHEALVDEAAALGVDEQASEHGQAHGVVAGVRAEGVGDGGLGVGTAVLVHRDAEALADPGAGLLGEPDAGALVGRVAHADHLRAGEELGHHLGVAEEAARAHDDGLAPEVHEPAVGADGLDAADAAVPVEERGLGGAAEEALDAVLLHHVAEDGGSVLALEAVPVDAEVVDRGGVAGRVEGVRPLHAGGRERVDGARGAQAGLCHETGGCCGAGSCHEAPAGKRVLHVRYVLSRCGPTGPAFRRFLCARCHRPYVFAACMPIRRRR